MADQEQHPEEFPDIGQKLSAPKKISQYERDRQAAEDKRKRAEAENAAALKEFQDSFGDDDGDDSLSHFGGRRGPPSGPRGGGGFGGRGGRYGMPPSGPRNAPGSLPGAPPSLKRKRALDEMREAQEARMEQGAGGFVDVREDDTGRLEQEIHDEEREDDAPKPCLLLSNLPPAMTGDEVKALLAGHVKVHSVRFLPSAGPVQVSGKRTQLATVTLSSEMSTGQIETAVGSLKDRYLGCGFFLSISRHLSSATSNPGLHMAHTANFSEPFGARINGPENNRMSLRNAPPPMDQRQGMFAPPSQYNPRASAPRAELVLEVHPPADLATIKVIHTIAEQLLVEPNPDRALEKEAMLMSLPEIQRDERFAFLYDSTSAAGVYYRHLLWSIDEADENTNRDRRKGKDPERLFCDVNMEWIPPFADVPFPDLHSLDQAITDIDYVSSDEDSDDEYDRRRVIENRDVDPLKPDKVEHLTPLQRAKLVHLLARLPTTNTRLRHGDVARITNFAISHAGSGAEEIVDILLLNIDRPFTSTLTARYEESDDEDGQDEDEYKPEDPLPTIEGAALEATPPMDTDEPGAERKRNADPSNAKLIALYIISDLLSASATAGARNAWKYRQLFETGFTTLNIFQRLGRLEKDLNWGRLKAEQWKRRVGVLFGIWEGWSVFTSDVLEELKKGFFEPPLTEEEKAAAEVEERREKAEKWKSKFKKVEGSASASPAPAPTTAPTAISPSPGMQREGSNKDTGGQSLPEDDIDGVPIVDDVDGQPMDDDLDGKPMEDIDGAPMEDDDLDGKPMDESSTDAPNMNQSNLPSNIDGTSDQALSTTVKKDGAMGFSIKGAASAKSQGQISQQTPNKPRRRLRAEDMFADSDEE